MVCSLYFEWKSKLANFLVGKKLKSSEILSELQNNCMIIKSDEIRKKIQYCLELKDTFFALNHLLTNREQTWVELKKLLTDGNFLANLSRQVLIDKLTSVEETLLIMKVKFPTKDINL